jgi:hypothetical protein
MWMNAPISHHCRHETCITPLIMSTRNLPTPPPEDPNETPTETPTETDHTTPSTPGAEEATTSTSPTQTQPQPTQIHTIYREVFPVIVNKVIDKDWSGLSSLGELHDLRVRSRYYAFNRGTPNLTSRYPQTEHDADASRLLLTTPLVLSYLILDDMYVSEASSAGFPLNLRDQSSCPVRINPSPLTTPASPPNRGTL